MSDQERRGMGSTEVSRELNRRRGKGLIVISFIAFLLLLIFNLNVRPTSSADTACDCNFCHGDQHGPGWQGCASCHGHPPATGSHIKHFGLSTNYQRYGDTGITQDFDSNATVYIMNCGNCHPTDNTKHRNGTLEVELYNAAAPAGSLKARNLASAAYTPGGTVTTYSLNGYTFSYSNGSCSDVYCHSYNDWTSGPVPDQACDAFVPPNVVTTRVYRTPTWGASLTCSGCHGNPPTTIYLTNDGGGGDSHYWLDDWGYGNLHMYNMCYEPISCRYCHNDTVRDVSTWTGFDYCSGIGTVNDTTLYNYSKHVNGIRDVAFDRVNSFPYSTPYSLSSASYDPANKTCSNVSCHQGQTSVAWGSPYRWYYEAECDRCHQMGYCP